MLKILSKALSFVLTGALAAYVVRGWRRKKDSPPGTEEDTAAPRKTPRPPAAGSAYMEAFDTIEALLEEGRPRAALNRIEKMLAEYPDEDNGPLLYSVSVCFDGLTDGKNPEAVLKAFDAMSEKSPAFKAAVALYGLEDFCDALAAAFVNIPDEVTKRSLRKAAALIREPHPLMLKTTVLYPEQAAAYLDSLARYVFEDWDEEGAPLGEILAKLDARLA